MNVFKKISNNSIKQELILYQEGIFIQYYSNNLRYFKPYLLSSVRIAQVPSKPSLLPLHGPERVVVIAL